MIEMDGEAYLAAVARRRRELGVTDEDDEGAQSRRPPHAGEARASAADRRTRPRRRIGAAAREVLTRRLGPR